MNVAPADLLADLAVKGIQLEPNGDKLRIRAATRPDEGTYELIRANKTALLALLTPENIQADIPNVPTSLHLPIGNKNESTAATVPGLDDHRALAVTFLEATEQLLITVKDERPPSFQTPQLKRDLKRIEAALSEYRAVLLPDDPVSTATGESLAEQYRRLN